jgi:hypothetical protein
MADVDDAVARYRSASEADDIDGLLASLAHDAMVCELDQDGLIRRVRPYLRPWLGLTFLALVLGPKLARHPGVLLRAARG